MVTDGQFAGLVGQVQQIRTELRRISTAELRSTVSGLVTDVNSVDSGQNGGTPVGGIIMWSGTVISIPTGWALCDGANGTPDLTDRFVVGAGAAYTPGDTGGADTVTLAESEIPAHVHSGPSHVHDMGSHIHTMPSHSHGVGTLVTVSDGAHTHIVDGARHDAGDTAHNHDSSLEFFSRMDSGGGAAGDVTSQSGGAHTHAITGSTESVDPGDTDSAILGDSGAAGTGNTGSTGGGSAHENRPPYYALAFIMRIA